MQRQKRLGRFSKILQNAARYAVSLGLLGLITVSALASLARRAQPVQTLRWAHVYEPSSPFHREALRVADEFHRRTDGRYRVLIYPASSLGNEVAINEALDLGAVDIIYTGASLVTRDYPPLGLAEYPFTVDDYEHWQAYRDSELFAELASAYGKVAQRQVVSLSYYGFRHVTSNRPIVSPKDMKGLKIRVPNAPAFMVMPLSTQANATPMPFSEVYLALQQGVVDAQENPLTTILYKRLYEVQSHINLTGHMCNSLLTLISNRTADKLGPRDSRIFKELAKAGGRRASDSIAGRERELTAWFREQGITVTEADRDAFRRVVRPAYDGPEAIATRQQYGRLRALVSQ